MSGRDTLRFGGDTICIEVACGLRSLIVDAGTGLRLLGADRPAGQSYEILFTHWHLDHVIGLMSFAPIYDPAARITLHAPVLDGRDPAFLLDEIFGPPFFPVRLWDAGADVRIRPFYTGASFALNGFAIDTIALSHPGGACGYRISDGHAAVAVVLDHEHPAEGADLPLAAFCDGVNLILYDAPFDNESDYPRHLGWGHSTWQAGLSLRESSGAARLCCIHHHPSTLDATIDARETRLKALHALSGFGRPGDRYLLGPAPSSNSPRPSSFAPAQD